MLKLAMLKKLGLIFPLLIFLFFPSSVLAGSPGLNLINNPGSFGYVPDSGPVSSWMTYIPETPQNLNTSSIPAPNVIVRLHAAWTDSGKDMLSYDYGVQEELASRWCAALNSLAQRKDSVYAIPFNELSHPTERQSPTGTITLDDAITRANRFISMLNACSNVTITSPALDPHNADFPTTSEAFSYPSVIAYHSYSPETTQSYNSGFLAGKQFLFSEVGTLVNGQVTYDDCALIQHFCGQQVAAYLQQQSSILAYTLFTFSPGDYSGGFWTLENPDVVHALNNQCDNLSIDPNTCRIGDTYTSSSSGESVLCAPVRPDGANHQNPVGPPDCQEHFYENIVKNWSPSNDYCAFDIPVEQNHPNSNYPQVTPADPNAPTPIPVGDITVHNTQEDKSYNRSRSPYVYTLIASFLKEIWSENIYEPQTLDQGGPDVRSTPKIETIVRKDITLMQAVLSLSESSNINAFDVEIGWGCLQSNGKVGYSRLNQANKVCRPIYMSELAAQTYVNNDPEAGAIKYLDENGDIASLFYSDIPDFNQNILDHYGNINDGYCQGNAACGYLQRLGAADASRIINNPSVLSKLGHYDYNHLWEKLPLLQKGATQMTLVINNTEESGSAVENHPLVVPYAGGLINSQKIKEFTRGSFFERFIPKSKIDNQPPLSGNYCQNPQNSEIPSQDTIYTSPNILTRFFNLFGDTIPPGGGSTNKTVKAKVETNSNLLQTSLDATEVAKSLIPLNAQPTEDDSDSYYFSNPRDENDQLRAPAPGNPSLLQEVKKYLTPKSQQLN